MPNNDPSWTRRRWLLATAATASGCWGSFNLTGKVYDWNGHFESKWVSWLIFLAFIILPVYGILLFVDALIINTIEFYSGNNPVKRNADLGGGHNLVFTPTEVPGRVHFEHRHHEKVVRSFYVERVGENEVRLLDRRGRQVAHVGGGPGGRVRLRDRDGRVVAHLDAEQHRRAIDAAELGDSVASTVMDALHENGEAERVLAMGPSIRRAC